MATIPSIPTIQLFRNSIIKTGRQAAIDALEAQKASVPDGGLILARYSIDGEDNNVKTLLGIVRNSGGANAELTVIDVEGAAENLQNAINNISREKVSEEGKAITSIRQENGVVFVEFGGVAAANVSVADTSDKFTATNVEGALLEIKTSLDNAIGTGGTVAEQISNKINTLNSKESGTSNSNHITVGVEQVAGKITSVTVSDSDIASAALLGTKEDASTAQTAFGYIAKEVADRTAAINALSTSSTVKLEDAAGTESGVLKVYTIKQGGTSVGTINIPKDLVVTSGSVVKGTWDGNTFTENVSGSGTALKLVIANQPNPVYINTLDLVKDHTGGNGIAISETNVISVVKDPASDDFLTVGADGVKLSGVKTAIDAAAASAKTKVEKTDGGSHVTLTSTTSTTDSSVTYTIGESDIASASALEDETTNRQNADTELSNRLGDDVTTDLTATAQLRALSGSPIDGKDVTSVYGAKAYAKDLVDNLNAEVGSTTGTSKTEAIKIVQAHGKIDSITLGAFDCGTY